MTISQSTFINCKSSDNDGNVINCRANIDLYIDNCRFVNCFAEGTQNQALVKYHSKNDKIVSFTDCTFQFSLETLSCPTLICDNSKVVFEHCIFSKCAAAILNQNVNDFKFIDNIVTTANQQVLWIKNLAATPVISGNIFKFNKLNNTNLINLVHNVDSIELFNNTFSSNSLVGNGQNIIGGGVGLSITRTTESTTQLHINECHFLENENDNTDSTLSSNHGGALHFVSSLSTELFITKCEFIGNKCNQGFGGAIATSVNKDVSIEECIFENNKASQGGNAIYVSQETTDSVKLLVSKCRFLNNGEVLSQSMISGSCVDLKFEENEIIYSNRDNSCQAISLSTKGKVSLTNTNFTNCSTSLVSSVSFSGQSDDSTITIKNCNFLNCKAASYTLQVSGGPTEIEQCTFSFDSNEQSSACGAINSNANGFICLYCIFKRTNAEGSLKISQEVGKTNAVTVSNCIFDDIGLRNTRCFKINTQTTSLTFSNNVIKNMKEEYLSYFGSISPKNQIDTLIMSNLTFIDNRCNTFYGGGSGLWITDVPTVSFEDCKFINNSALSSGISRGQQPDGKFYASGDGGAIQYGFSKSIFNISMKFDNCLFSKNKAVRHGGALAIQTIGTVEITNCIFEENIANYKPSSSSRMLEEPNNYFDLKEEGRGGAIYINPWFSYKDLGSQANNFLKSIKIENCQFTSNSAFDGFAIYIEGDDPGTIFTIQNNNFTNNYDQTENSQNRGVIITEIERLLKEPIVTSNTFNPYPNNYNIYPIIFVNHSARTPEPTPLPTPMATPNEEVFDTNNCNPRCYHVHEEETSYILFHLPDYEVENLINDSVSGSAVYLENTGLNVTRSSFTN